MHKDALKKKLESIHSCFRTDVSMIREFINKTGKSLTRKQKKLRLTDLPAGDKKELEKLQKFFTSVLGDMRKIETAQISIKSEKLGEIILGFLIPLKQKRFLAEMTLSYLVCIQEAFVKEYLKTILTSRRGLLKSKKILTFEEVCDFSSMRSLISHIAQKEVDVLLYGGIDDISKYFEDRFNLSLSAEFTDWPILREASYRRNLIVHNRGITNKLYCSRTKYRKINDRLITDIDYVDNVAKGVLSFINFIHSRMIAKLALTSTGRT